MIDDASIGLIRFLIRISRLRMFPAGRWATPIPCGLRRRANASEVLAMYEIACHMLGPAILLPAGRFRRVFWTNELGRANCRLRKRSPSSLAYGVLLSDV